MGGLIAIAGLILVFLAALWFSARRDITICVLEIREGEISVAEGTISPRVLADLRDVVRRPRVKSATIRVLRAKDFGRAEASGKLSSEQLQQVRNIVGTVNIAKLSNGKVKSRV